MSQDRRTRAQLLDALDEAREARDAADLEAQESQLYLADMDLESKVIAGCVSHLDLFQEAGDDVPCEDGDSYAGGRLLVLPPPGDPRVVRVLGYLARRYGLPDPREEVEQLTQELGRVNAELHRARGELSRLRHAVAQLQHDDPQF